MIAESIRAFSASQAALTASGVGMHRKLGGDTASSADPN